MKNNYETPQVILVAVYEDVITASTPETTGGFEKDWLDEE